MQSEVYVIYINLLGEDIEDPEKHDTNLSLIIPFWGCCPMLTKKLSEISLQVLSKHPKRHPQRYYFCCPERCCGLHMDCQFVVAFGQWYWVSKIQFIVVKETHGIVDEHGLEKTIIIYI